MQDEIISEINKLCFEYIIENIDLFEKDDQIVASIFMFIEYCNSKNKMKYLNIMNELEFELLINSSRKSIKLLELLELIDRTEINIILTNKHFKDNKYLSISEYEKYLNSLIDTTKSLVITDNLLLKIVTKYLQLSENDIVCNEHDEKLVSYNDEIIDYTLNKYYSIKLNTFNARNSNLPFPKNLLIHKFENVFDKNKYIGSRKYFPAFGKYKELAVKLPAEEYYHNLLISKIWTNLLILPYKFSIIDNLCYFAEDYSSHEDLFKWVYSHRLDKNVSSKRIKALYADLISDFKPIITECNNFKL